MFWLHNYITITSPLQASNYSSWLQAIFFPTKPTSRCQKTLLSLYCLMRSSAQALDFFFNFHSEDNLRINDGLSKISVRWLMTWYYYYYEAIFSIIHEDLNELKNGPELNSRSTVPDRRLIKLYEHRIVNIVVYITGNYSNIKPW